jgi:hypothetical protein
MPQDIERELREFEQQLYDVQSTYGEIARNAARARFEYDIAWADAIDELEHRVVPEGQKKPTVEVMKAQATKMVAAKMEAARMAEVELEIAKKTIDNIHSRLSSCQTRSKMTQIELSLAR